MQEVQYRTIREIDWEEHEARVTVQFTYDDDPTFGPADECDIEILTYHAKDVGPCQASELDPREKVSLHKSFVNFMDEDYSQWELTAELAKEAGPLEDE